MIVFFQPSRDYAGGVVVNVAPSSIVAQTMAGVAIETLTHTIDADGHWSVDTTDALYTHGTKYELITTTTTALGVVTEDHPFVHVATAIGTPPGPPTIGTPSIGEEQATFPHTPPPDAGYTSTTIFAIPVLGGTVVEGSGSGALIIVLGLVPGVLYAYLPVAYGAGGAASDPGNVMLATTLPATDIEMPAYLKWWVNDEDEMHEHGPEAFDPSVTGDRRFHDLGRGRTWSLMIECHEPVFFGVRGIGGVMTVPRGQPGGLRDDKGT